MKFIEWCELFRIGHPTIDTQHQELFAIANKFHEIVYKGFNKALVNETLNAMTKYAQKHFDAEEEIVKKHGYPADACEKHHNVHESLIMDLFDVNEKIEKGEVKSLHEVEKFITRWLILHILVQDKKYSEYLLNQPIEE